VDGGEGDGDRGWEDGKSPAGVLSNRGELDAILVHVTTKSV